MGGDRSMPEAGRWGGTLLKVAVSAAAAAIVLSRVDAGALLGVLGRADARGVVLTLVLYLVGQLVTAYRWQLIARRVGFGERTTKVFLYYYIGMFFNLFGPSTLGGDLARALYLGGASGRRAAALHTVVLDRAVGMVMLIVVAVAAMALFGRMGVPAPAAYLTAAVGVAVAVVWWALPPLSRMVLSSGHRWRRVIEDELSGLWRDPSLFGRITLISIFFHVLQISALVLLGKAVGVPVPWQYYFVFHPLVTVLSAIPVSLAGLGIRELGYVYFLSDLHHAPREAALALALLWLGVLVTSSLVGGLAFLASGGTLPSLRSRAADQPSEAQRPSSS
ncbi:MAG: UPF0104 family protein [Deltaproteobacteria bacterium]|nr:MAG: UPF0104 family protein [Deltaproteobacteria bacterium]